MGANEGISYSIFERFSNFQSTKKFRILKKIFDKNKIKTFWVMKISGPRFPPMFMLPIEKVRSFFKYFFTFR